MYVCTYILIINKFDFINTNIWIHKKEITTTITTTTTTTSNHWNDTNESKTKYHINILYEILIRKVVLLLLFVWILLGTFITITDCKWQTTREIQAAGAPAIVKVDIVTIAINTNKTKTTTTIAQKKAQPHCSNNQ